MPNSVRVGACQTPEFRENIGRALDHLQAQAMVAAQSGIELLVFAEGYLQGYLTEPNTINKFAYDLDSDDFASVLSSLKWVRPTLVFGLIEQSDGAVYNSAVVIAEGRLVGRYRKTHLLPGESVFSAGTSYPVFDCSGLKFGINICYDTQFPEAAAAVKAAGAVAILCPANNMMRRVNAEKWKYLHHEMRCARAKETGLWVVSADVTGEHDGRIGYGPTSVINGAGEVVEQVSLLTTGMVVADIPIG